MTKSGEPHFFDVCENVKEYIVSTSGSNRRALVEILKTYLNPESTVLEIGIGPGTDLDILSEAFNVTGSDNSRVFLDLYRRRRPDVALLLLNAVTLVTNRRFDCIFSNKVLHHLTLEELAGSFGSQVKVLNPDGIAFHTFWRGTGSAEFQGLQFNKYLEDSLLELTKTCFNPLEIGTYAEMNRDDSIYLVLQKRA